jgi:lactam utilization protein B
MTDASRVLTGSHRPDWYNPKLWDYVDRAVELGKEHGVVVGANTSYAYDLDELGRRVEILAEHGVRMIMAQGAPFIFQLAATKFLADLKPILED